MRVQELSFLAIIYLGLAAFVATEGAHAQQAPRRIALKSGESTELRNYYFVQNCRSIMIDSPILDVLEGPEELTVTPPAGHESAPEVHKTSARRHGGRNGKRSQSAERRQAYRQIEVQDQTWRTAIEQCLYRFAFSMRAARNQGCALDPLGRRSVGTQQGDQPRRIARISQ
jgi:hypothetical protein